MSPEVAVPSPPGPGSALRGLASDVVAPVTGLFGARPARRVAGRTGRSHIEVRGLNHAERAETARLLEKQLRTLSGVHGAVVNAPLARVVVDHEPAATTADLLRTVAEFERAHRLDVEEPDPTSSRHPADRTALTRHVVALVTDLAGLGLTVGERALGVIGPGFGLPPVLTASLSLVDTVPVLRDLVERGAGASAAESWFALGSSFAQAVGRGPLGLVGDACYRATRATEAVARRRVWDEWDRAADLAAHHAAPCEVGERPASLRSGPVELVGNAAGAASLAALGVTAWLVPQRAVAVLLAGVPKSARWGRESFAAAAVRGLAADGTLVIDPMALRRGDRIDVVVLDGALPGATAGALHDAAGRVGRVVVTDTTAPGTEALVHDRQRDGAGVAVVAADGAEALAAADLSVGVGSGTPWTADVRCAGVTEARAVLEVARVAPTASGVVATLAVLASVTAVPLAVASRLPGLAGRVNLPISAGALLALGVGTAAGTAVSRSAPPG